MKESLRSSIHIEFVLSPLHNCLSFREMKVIYEWSKTCPPASRGPVAKSSIFLSTHEPCCMCISGITWTGFERVFYFFPYEITSEQGIPHDMNIMHELWGVKSYRKQNQFCNTANLMEMIRNLEESEHKNELIKIQNRLIEKYAELSEKYHSEKEQNVDNSLVFG